MSEKSNWAHRETRAWLEENEKRLASETAPEGKLYAFYSQQQAELAGTQQYRREDGRVITTSMVSKNRTPDVGWKDIELLGEVLEHGCVSSTPRRSGLDSVEIARPFRYIYANERAPLPIFYKRSRYGPPRFPRPR